MDNIQIELEGVLTIRKDGELIAVVDNNIQKKSQIFSSCKAMGTEEIKSLLESLHTK